jgi:hypothetical protein
METSPSLWKIRLENKSSFPVWKRPTCVVVCVHNWHGNALMKPEQTFYIKSRITSGVSYCNVVLLYIWNKKNTTGNKSLCETNFLKRKKTNIP